MRKVFRVSLGLVIVGALAGWLHWAGVFHSSRHVDHSSRHVDRAELAAEPERPNEAAAPRASDEVTRLRAELQKSQALVLALASGLKNDEAKTPPQGTATPTVDEEEPPRAVDILDERMFTAPQDQAKSAEMERALRGVLDATQLSEAKVSSLFCAPNLCKITVSAQTGAALGRSVTALAEHLPKVFGASAVYELSNGESALYVAKANQDLDVQPAETHASYEPQRSGVVMHEGEKASEITGRK